MIAIYHVLLHPQRPEKQPNHVSSQRNIHWHDMLCRLWRKLVRTVFSIYVHFRLTNYSNNEKRNGIIKSMDKYMHLIAINGNLE